MSEPDAPAGNRLDACGEGRQDELPDKRTREGARLDPQDPAAFRTTAHALLDACLDRSDPSREPEREPAWRSPPDALPGDLHGLPEPVPRAGMAPERISEELTRAVMPYLPGDHHPRSLGRRHGVGPVDGLLGELIAASMNADGEGDEGQHIGLPIERRVIDWCASLHGLPESAGGLITQGTSMATLLALQAARVQRFGATLRIDGQRPVALLYAAADIRPGVVRAAELLGLGGDAVRELPLDKATGSVCLETLAQRVGEDRAAGHVPLCLVGIAGSADTGRFDDLSALADAAREHALWFHVDAVCGGWAVIAEEPWRSLARGLEQADSMVFDFNRWPYIADAAGAVLVRDGSTLRAQGDGDDPLAAGTPAAVKIWTALRRHGIEALGAAISDNCRQAGLMAELVEAAPELRLVTPVALNVCCFALSEPGDDPDGRHRRLAAALRLSGEAILSTTRQDGQLALRAAFCNHRTRAEDVHRVVEAVRRETASPS